MDRLPSGLHEQFTTKTILLAKNNTVNQPNIVSRPDVTAAPQQIILQAPGTHTQRSANVMKLVAPSATASVANGQQSLVQAPVVIKQEAQQHSYAYQPVTSQTIGLFLL